MVKVNRLISYPWIDIGKPPGDDIYYEFSRGHGQFGLRVNRAYGVNNKLWAVYAPGRWQNSGYWAVNSPTRDIRNILLKEGFSVATFDYRSHFISKYRDWREMPRDLYNWTATEVSDDFIESLEWLIGNYRVENLILIGFSLGVSTVLLSQTNKKIRSITNGIVLLDGGLANPANISIPNSSIASEQFVAESNVFKGATRRSIENELKKRGCADRVDDGLFRSCNSDMLRLLLLEDRWWSSLHLNQLKVLSCNGQFNKMPMNEIFSTITAPILGFAAVPVDNVGVWHKTILSIGRTSSSNKTIISLVGWKHLEVVAGDDTGLQVNIKILEWLQSISSSPPTPLQVCN